MDSNTVRKPGAEFTLTDEELLAAPPRMLSSRQRRRRRLLKRDIYQARTRARELERKNGTAARLKQCQGYTKKGDPCSRPSMNGAKHCRIHLNDAELAKLNLRPSYELMKTRVNPTKKIPGPVLMREVTEVAVEKLVHRYFLAVGLEFVGFDVDNNPIVIDKGVKKGICLHGESKDGYVEMSEYPDLVAQVQIMEKLLDRVYGKPKQTQVLEGGIKPVQVQPVRSVERAQGMAAMLQRSGALPPAPDGNGNGTDPHANQEVTEGEGKVVTEDVKAEDVNIEDGVG